MKKQTNNILKIILFLGLGGLFVWLSIRNISQQQRHDIITAIKQADHRFVFLSFLIGIPSHYFRAVRWKILLAPLNHYPKTSNTFFAVMVGYWANLAVPRLGEVSRCAMLNRHEKIPFTEGFGSVIAERAFDLLCLILIFFLALFMEFDKIYGIADHLILTPFAEKYHKLLQQQLLLIIVVVLLVIISGTFFYFRKKLKDIFSTKVRAFVTGLWEGLIGIKNVKQPVWFIGTTVLIWLMYILQAYVCFFAFPGTATLPFMAAMVIMVFGSLGVIVSPGGIGAYQAILIPILISAYAVAEPQANAFAWVVWAAQIALMLVLGPISFALLSLLNKKNKATE